jgi:hypothetical protein
VARGTVGGMVAAGLAGPARATAGGVRDHVLGATLLNGRGELLSFGGQVMKNVAGYDVSRALAGSMGVLGVVCEVSLKVLPVAPASATMRFECGQAEALTRLNAWGGEPLPITGSAWWNGMLVVRLAGARAAVESAQRLFEGQGGEAIDAPLAAVFWRGLRDHGDEFFAAAARAEDAGAALWRLGVPATAAPLLLPGEQLIEWSGAQRWWCTSASAATVRDMQLFRAPAARRGDPTPAPECSTAGDCSAPRPPPEAPRPRRPGTPKPSCASACTAASAPPPAPPTSCWATSWTARAAASTSSSRCSKAPSPRAPRRSHLDRCLTCRNCESTCPSGVQYGHLVDIGRKIVDQKGAPPRSPSALCAGCSRKACPRRCSARPWRRARGARLLPARSRPRCPPPRDAREPVAHARTRARCSCWGCVQPAMMPNINAATARVLDAAGIQTHGGRGAGCCGAIRSSTWTTRTAGWPTCAATSTPGGRWWSRAARWKPS